MGTGCTGYRFDPDDPGETGSALFVKTDGTHAYEYTDTNIRVLVVLGDVNVTRDFTGLLMATGNINISNGVSITSIVNATDTQLQELKRSLQTAKEVNIDASLTKADKKALQYFVDGSEYDLDGLQSNSSTVSKNKVDFTELVMFNNWVKR